MSDDIQGYLIEEEKPRRRGCLPTWLVALLGLVLLIGGSFFICGVVPSFVIGYFGEQTRPVPGDASNFDPIANYGEIEAYAREFGGGSDLKLQSMRIRYVRSDGTMDLHADYNPGVDVEYVHTIEDEENDRPIGAGGSISGKLYERFNVAIFSPNSLRSVTSTNSEYTYVHFGMGIRRGGTNTSDNSEALPPPTCDIKDFWEVAKTRDAPDNAVATIDYDDDGYTFRISDMGINIEFDQDCNVR